MGIHRSDYMLHRGSTNEEGARKFEVRQIEFNTIAASFSSLSKTAGDLHHYITSRCPSTFGDLISASELPPNKSAMSFAKSLSIANEIYESKIS